jgi:hypothetical protein
MGFSLSCTISDLAHSKFPSASTNLEGGAARSSMGSSSSHGVLSYDADTVAYKNGEKRRVDLDR